jgi:ketosteroid isomerase-like protein
MKGTGMRSTRSFQTPLRRPLCIALAAISGLAASARQKSPVESDQQTLVRLERTWNEAFYRKDITVIAQLLADDFMATYDDGNRGDKTKELALAREFNQQVESAFQDDFIVRVYGDAAVVSFTLRLIGLRQGQRAEVTLRFTDVWVIREGRWQCVSSQSTKVSPS